MPKRKRMLTMEEKIKIKESKEELIEYMNDCKYITEKLNDTEETRTMLEKVTSTISPTKNFSNFGSDKFADGISKLDELEKLCDYKLKKLLEKKFVIDDKIENLPQPYKNVLFYKYSRGKKWTSVAEELGYTRDYVCKELHPEALYLYSKTV